VRLDRPADASLSVLALLWLWLGTREAGRCSLVVCCGGGDGWQFTARTG
jgi:hypothetical protein